MRSRNHIAIALAVMVVFVGVFLWREHAATGTFGFPLDDSWIHAQFARNIVLGHGFSYNPGEPAAGSTAPLWTFVAATGYLIAGDPVLGAKALGILFLGLTVWLVYTLVKIVTGDPREALFSAVVAASLPRLLWASVSGMEVTLAVALSLAGILMHILHAGSGSRRQYLSTVLFGLATLARPECAVFFVAAMLDRALVGTFIHWRDLAAKEWVVPVLAHIALFAAVLLPFLLFSRRFGIGFLPNTAYAKALLWNKGLISAFVKSSPRELLKSLSVHPFDYYISFLQESLKNNPVLFALVPFGFLRLTLSIPYARDTRYQSFILPLAVVLFPLAIGIVVPFGDASYQEGRYAAPVAPLMLIIGTMGLYAAASYGARIFSEAKFMGSPARVVLERSLIWFLMVLALFAQGRSIWFRSKLYAREVANIEDMQVTLGKWVDQSLPRDAVLAVNDVGAIAYFSQRKVLDTVGLISPDVLEYRRRGKSADAAMFSLLASERPDYAILFPDWYPQSVRKSIFEPIHRVVLKDNVVCGGDEMVVYALHWEDFDSPEGASRRTLQPGGARPGENAGARGDGARPGENAGEREGGARSGESAGEREGGAHD
ncbi:MAG: glycosyltransferase family 39 protein [Candidatus Eisenbacteria bacterium]